MCAYVCAYIHGMGSPKETRCRRIVEAQDPGRHRKYSHCVEWAAAAREGRRVTGGAEPWRFCWQHRIRGPSQPKGD
jgi:hypothetical protein